MASRSRKPLSKVVRDFSESTTLHGVSYLGKGSVVRRLLWFLAILMCFGITSFEVYVSTELFASRPISTSFTQERAKELEFPAVTICNFNAFIVSKYENSYLVGMNLSAEERQRRTRFAAKISHLVSGGGEFANLSEIPERVLQETAVVDYLSQTSQGIEDMLSSKWPVPCKFGVRECGPQNFTLSVSQRFGNCFTFNSGTKDGEPLKVKMAGVNGGLKLTLFLDQASYAKNLVIPQAGFKILIHHQNEYPFVEELGFAVQPGTHTFCAIRRKKMESLPAPFRTDCSEKHLHIMDYFGVGYSRPACISECMLLSIVRRCKCQPFQPILPLGEVKLCTIDSIARCAIPIHGDVDEKTQHCFDDCPEPCSRVKYETTLSYAAVLSNAFTATDLPLPGNRHNDSITRDQTANMSEEERASFFRNEVVGLDVYYEELSQDIIKQQKAFPALSLLGNIGGYFGLFLGMSVLTFVEFLDFVATVLQSLRSRSVKSPERPGAMTGEAPGETAT